MPSTRASPAGGIVGGAQRDRGSNSPACAARCSTGGRSQIAGGDELLACLIGSLTSSDRAHASSRARPARPAAAGCSIATASRSGNRVAGNGSAVGGGASLSAGVLGSSAGAGAGAASRAPVGRAGGGTTRRVSTEAIRGAGAGPAGGGDPMAKK
jgi:hypothetical protein